MTALQAEHMWQEAFPEKTRPKLYISQHLDEDGFRPLADPQDFIKDLSKLNGLQSYALSNNNAIALKAAQDEYLQLTREIAAIKGRDTNVKDPQALLDAQVFEDKKEAALYGYEYRIAKPAALANLVPFIRTVDDLSEQEKRDVRIMPDPFVQGGFVPTDRQYRGMLNRAKDPRNVDGWKPVEKNGKFYVPVQQTHHDEYTAAYTRRAIDENGEVIRPVSVETEDSQATPSKPVNKRLTRTRFGGKKHPPTRDVSESPSLPSTPGRKRPATPMEHETRETTPNKRPKLEAPPSLPLINQPPQPPPKPKHPNQYTKAREREMAAQQAARAAAGGALPPPPAMPDFSAMTAEEKLNRKWTDDELRASITTDHTWLNPDPAKAAEWRDKILHGVNPVRSWSMVKKWSQWKSEKKDKRPRKKLNVVNGDDGTTVVVNGSRSATPANVAPEQGRTPVSSQDTIAVGGAVQHVDHGSNNNRMREVLPEAHRIDKGKGRADLDDGQRWPYLEQKRSSSEGEIVVNGGMHEDEEVGMNGGRPPLTRRSTRNR